MTPNRALIYASHPRGAPIAGTNLTIVDRPIDLSTTEPPENGLLVRNAYLSYDPFQRGRMRPAEIKSYSPAYNLNSPIINSGISHVLKSANPKFKEGDVVEVYMACPVEEYSVLPAALVERAVFKIDTSAGVELKHYLHALGMPGLTAYSSLREIAGPLKKGETLFVSSAAGAVGQIVGQLAKHEGLKVIGSVGSKEKSDFITQELGFDGAFNYKEEKAAEALKRLAPEGVDVYFDNVGGEQLEAAIAAMKEHGRIVACGMVSQYNLPPAEQYPIRNLTPFVRCRIKLQGLIVGDPNFGPKYQKEHRENVTKWLKDGSLKAKIDETVGIENAAEGLVGMLEGKNFGKAVLKIAD